MKTARMAEKDTSGLRILHETEASQWRKIGQQS